MIIQIILVLFFVVAIISVLKKYREGAISSPAAMLWILFWIAAGAVVIVPNSTYYFARLVGITRGADLVVYSALALIFFILFRVSVRLEKMNKEITKLTRAQALCRSREANSQVK